MSENEKKIFTEFGETVNKLNAAQIEKLVLIGRGMLINEEMHRKAV